MQDTPLVQLLVLLAFILLPLINVLIERMQGRSRRIPPAERAPQPSPRPRPVPPAAAIPRREPVAVPEQAVPAPIHRRGVSGRRRLFRDRTDLRRAVILMAVLGPPRASEPQE